MSSHSILHGNVKDRSDTVLLLIDVINPFDFPGSEGLLENALPASRQLLQLKQAAREKGIPVIYANDNFGRWRSTIDALIRYCSRRKGSSIVKLLMPGPSDYFVLKPKNSAFYATTLDLLLRYIRARKLILGGLREATACCSPPMTLTCGTTS